MREIKFRGKGLLDKEWIYGGYFILRGETKIACEEYKGPNGKLIYWTVDPATVGQYTGLKDKNGVEIYEGDIVCVWSGCTGVVRIGTYNDDFLEYSPTICGVYCNEIGGANHNFGLTQYFTNEAEVVGNVHDDAGLLEK